MSEITVSVDSADNITVVKKRKSDLDLQQITLKDLELNKNMTTTVKCTKADDKNRVFYLAQLDPSSVGFEWQEEEAPWLCVFEMKGFVTCAAGSYEVLIKKFLKFANKVFKVRLTKKWLSLWVVGYFINPRKLKLDHANLKISDSLKLSCAFPEEPARCSKGHVLLHNRVQKLKVPVSAIVAEEDSINFELKVSADVDGKEVSFPLAKRKRKWKRSRSYFAPMTHCMYKDLLLMIRRNAGGNLVLVKRLRDEFEYTLRYRIMESRLVSGLLYYSAKLLNVIRRKKINLYFEKETMKAEEGTYEVFQLAQRSKCSRNYYIIDEKSSDYKRISDHKGVIKKYSLKYYYLVFNAVQVITTEAPAHINILRSANKYLRLKLVEYKFAFLQHGVTYMKRHENASAFVKGREAAPDYMFVGSEKEQDIVVEMLRLPEENVLVTGLPIFSTIPYKHINENSENYVTIMLTFKPYEERLDDFENSRYYKSILELYAILKKYVPEEKILIVAHPRIHYLLERTSLKGRMWDRPISEMLAIAKLIVTDYSSVAYNSFYQGGGVIFYQEDISEYQAVCGQLIPEEEEYIGRRAFDLKQFEDIIADSTSDGKIIMSKVRTPEHEKNYNSINQFSDGKNVERIYEALLNLKMI